MTLPPFGPGPGPAEPAPAVSSGEVADRLDRVRSRIRQAGGDLARVRVVAVTKGFGVDAVRASLACGIEEVGENYADELLAKATAIAEEPGGQVPRWHFLGAIQRNKVARLAPVVACWETVSRVEEGIALLRRAPGSEVLVQVDASGLPGHNGCPPEGVGLLVAQLRGEGLDVRGLMTVGVAGSGDRTKAVFRAVAAMADDLGLPERSMGMSDDLELAVAAGATMVRLGRALFGPRPAGTAGPRPAATGGRPPAPPGAGGSSRPG